MDSETYFHRDSTLSVVSVDPSSTPARIRYKDDHVALVDITPSREGYEGGLPGRVLGVSPKALATEPQLILSGPGIGEDLLSVLRPIWEAEQKRVVDVRVGETASTSLVRVDEEVWKRAFESLLRHDEGPLIEKLRVGPAPVLLLRHPERVSDPRRFFGTLRALAESPELSNGLRIALVGASWEVAQHAVFSGYASLAKHYRAAPWGKQEILAWWSYRFKQPGDGLAEAVYNSTGGEPALVQALGEAALREAKGLPRESTQRRGEQHDASEPLPTLDKSHLRKAEDHLVDHPPHGHREWAQALRNILLVEGRPSPLVEDVRTYLRGETLGPTHFPPPAEQAPLYHAGWLGVDSWGRWGIRSSLHARWARRIVDGVRGLTDEQ